MKREHTERKRWKNPLKDIPISLPTRPSAYWFIGPMLIYSIRFDFIFQRQKLRAVTYEIISQTYRDEYLTT